jgi:hypothetical protein
MISNFEFNFMVLSLSCISMHKMADIGHARTAGKGLSTFLCDKICANLYNLP